MKVTFLAANVPLSKSFSIGSDGQLQKSSYPSVREFTSITEDVPDLKAFAERLKAHAALGRCLLKGNVIHTLTNESRAGSTDPNADTIWVCLDLDRSQLPTVDAFLASIELAGIDYVVQYSASHGIERDRGLVAHVFMMLNKAALPAQLKQWLIHINLKYLSAGLELTKTNTALSWPLDVTTCQNDKLLYIAPPTLGPGIESSTTERIQYCERGSNTLSIPADLPSAEQQRTEMEKQINRLRESRGLEKRNFKYREDGTLAKCDVATMTGIKRERGFTYFNLNGGDSWGYWHTDENPSVIRNFKGEPDYLTKELLPEYWAQITDAAAKTQAQTRSEIETSSPAASAELPRALVFRDFRTGLYYNGVWDAANDKLQLAQAKSETQIQHFLLERGLPEVDYIPTWDVIFDPHSDVRVDFSRRRVNLWTPSKYMKQDFAPVERAAFPTIDRIIAHAVASDENTRDHFYNSLACVYQYRVALMTSWLLHGVQGTGKGVLVNHILSPIFGRQYVVIKRMEELEDQFNEYLEQALFVVIDEAQISESKKSKMIMANLKNQITEPTITIRKMRTAAYAVRNYCNYLILSNMSDPVTVERTDRRFNVGEFQDQRLVLTDKEIAAIADELPAFAAFLQNYAADLNRARTVINTPERERIIATSQTSTELVAEALTKGQLELFWESLPTGDSSLLPVSQQLTSQAYTDLVHAALHGKNRFTRDELRVLFEFLCGDMPRTPTKFTQLLRHKNLHLRVMKIDDRSVRGLEVAWNVDPAWIAERKAELSIDFTKLKVA